MTDNSTKTVPVTTNTPAVGIKSAMADGNGNMKLTFTDNTTQSIILPKGAQGLQGAIGPAGLRGLQGLQGPQGPQGPQGLQGPQGPAGPMGSIKTATTESQGNLILTMADSSVQTVPLPHGVPGIGIKLITQDQRGNMVLTLSDGSSQSIPLLAGPAGPQGLQGSMGPAGPQGSAGPMGPAGPKGDTGAQGSAGPKGDTGAAGPKGDTGTQGSAGPMGPAGPKGDTGAAGPQGPKGDTGAAGAIGPAGPQGPPGPAGTGVAAFNTVAPTNQGAYIGWNAGCTNSAIPGGCAGSTDFINQRGLGHGGFQWVNFDKDNKFVNQEMSLDGTGNLNVLGAVNLIGGNPQYGVPSQPIAATGNVNSTNVNTQNVNASNAVYTNTICDAANAHCYSVNNGGNFPTIGSQQNKLCIGPATNNWCFVPNANGQWLDLIRNNAPDQADSAVYHFTQDGNIWLNRSTSRGWVADNASPQSTVRVGNRYAIRATPEGIPTFLTTFARDPGNPNDAHYGFQSRRNIDNDWGKFFFDPQ